jgi:hypothetical protein
MNKSRRNFWLDVLIFFTFVVIIISAVTIHAHEEADLTTRGRPPWLQSHSLWLQTRAADRLGLLRQDESEFINLGLTRFTWVQIHAAAGLSLLLGLGVHFVWHWDWIKAAFKPSVQRKSRPIRCNRTVDAGLFVAFALICLSGVVMWLGGDVDSVTLLGLSSEVWQHLHGIAAIVMLGLTIIHLVLHWKWIVTTARRCLWSTVRKRLQPVDQHT